MDKYRVFERCPNSMSGDHNYTVTGKNKVKAEKFGYAPCRFCGKLIIYEADNKKPLESEDKRG